MKAKWRPRAQEIEIAVARFFNPRINLIVPNVSWGLGLRHEADLVVVSASGYAKEIEIKVTKSDLKRDRLKLTSHEPRGIFKQLFFAVPSFLVDDAESLCPEIAGILGVGEGGFVQTIRAAKTTPVPPLSDAKIEKLGRLAAMRIWSLKEKLFDRVSAPTISEEPEV